MQVGGCDAGRWAGLHGTGLARPEEERTGFPRQVMPHGWQVEVRTAESGGGKGRGNLTYKSTEVSFSQKSCTEHLIWARHRSRHWSYSREPKTKGGALMVS